MAEKKEKEKEGGVEAKVRKLEARIDRMQENWKAFVGTIREGAEPGKKFGEFGNVRIAFVVAILVMSVGVLVALAGSREVDQKRDATGVGAYRLTTDDDGTIDMTLTGDLVVTGSVSSVTSSGGVTSPVSTAVIVPSALGKTKQAVYTFSSVSIIASGGPLTNASGGVKIGVMPEGVISFDGCVVDNLTTATNAHNVATNLMAYSLGTAVGSGPALSGTEANVAPTQVVTQVTNVYDTHLTSDVIVDGSATALDLYLNIVVNPGATHIASTNLVSGSATLTYTPLGDN